VPPERVFARQTQPESSASPEHASLDLRLPPVPATLVQPEAAQRRRTVIMGVVAGVVFGSAVGLLSPSASAMHQMFDPRTPAAAVPIAILCLFFWGIAQGLSRRRRVIAIESMNRPELLPAVLDGLDSHGIKGLNDAVKVDAAAHSPLLRRVRVAVEQWLLRPSMQNASLAVEQQIVADQDSTQRGYTLLRIFVWATPVLGLIGTVVGISIAVGGFAHFLSTNVDDVSKIKEGLVGVTGGLSFAFLITLEGLLTSLILMLFTSSLQTREERLYMRRLIDPWLKRSFQLYSAFVLRRIPRAMPECRRW
jgi:biopolymer transport protein ExbB/TolQ